VLVLRSPELTGSSEHGCTAEIENKIIGAISRTSEENEVPQRGRVRIVLVTGTAVRREILVLMVSWKLLL
jgi:hypothetical protein